MITTNSSGNPLSSGYTDAVQADTRSFLAELLVNGTALDCAIKRIEISKGSCGSSTEFSVGNLISSTMVADLRELTDDVKDAEVEVRIGLDISGTYEWVTVGFFTISDVKKNVYATTITGHGRIVAKGGGDFNVPATQTLSQLAYAVGVGLGCTATLDSGIDGSLEITQPLNGLTNYQALQIIASVVGGYAIDTADGNVKICLFNNTVTHAVDAGMMVYLPNVGEQDFAITGVRCVVSEASSDGDGEIPAVSYEQGTVNLQMNNKYMTQALFNDMAGDLIGYTYRPASIDLTLGDPRIEGDDVLAVTDADGAVYTVPCHIITHTYSGGFHSTIDAVRATNSEDGIGTMSPMQTMMSEISSGVVSAKSEATKARTIAGTTAQYFWYESNDPTETGAHITEVPQADWEDPTSQGYHSGGNLFARSNGIAVRDGLTELAVFGANGARIGIDTDAHSVIDNNGQRFYANRYIQLANIGYGETQEQGQQRDTPYYTFGTRDVVADIGAYSFATGYNTIASAEYTHTEGWYTQALKAGAHAEGDMSVADGNSAHAEGHSQAKEDYAHAEGYNCKALSDYSHAEGSDTSASGLSSHTEGAETKTGNAASHAEGYKTEASGLASHAEGNTTKATSSSSHAEGTGTESNGSASHTEGNATKATADYSHAEGLQTESSQTASHAEGTATKATANSSHAEGITTTASGTGAHAEGITTTASADGAHAEGVSTTASATGAHAGGNSSVASGDMSFAHGYGAVAQGAYQTVFGRDNNPQGSPHTYASTDYAVIVGNGTRNGTVVQTSDALTLDWDGNLTIAGTLTQASDRRLKEHIKYLDDDADQFINKLKPAQYKKGGETHLGFYAQDVEGADPWNCMTGEMNGYKTLGYIDLIAPLVAYCQHLESRVAELERSRDEQRNKD